MFFVTNRKIRPGKSGLDQFGASPNASGPNELRMVRTERSGDQWTAELLPDTLTPAMKKEIGVPVSRKAFARGVISI